MLEIKTPQKGKEKNKYILILFATRVSHDDIRNIEVLAKVQMYHSRVLITEMHVKLEVDNLRIQSFS